MSTCPTCAGKTIRPWKGPADSAWVVAPALLLVMIEEDNEEPAVATGRSGTNLRAGGVKRDRRSRRWHRSARNRRRTPLCRRSSSRITTTGSGSRNRGRTTSRASTTWAAAAVKRWFPIASVFPAARPSRPYDSGHNSGDRHWSRALQHRRQHEHGPGLQPGTAPPC